MRGRFPDETLAEIRERANIVEVASAHVGLRRVGRNHVGLCPFHAEKTPSFTVSEDRGIFHCFGCGVGGNVFTFLMRMESLAFPEAVERLARRYGVPLPERGTDDAAARLRERLFRLNDKAARWFRRLLWEGREAEPARAYLAERGVGRELAERFGLGWAPAGGDALVRRLRASGEPLDLAAQLGLVGEHRGGHHDRFRGRLIFPIADASGRVVGFGSRAVPGTESAAAGLPKYVNSPETPLYRKGAQLYGLAVARDAVRTAGRVLVVEGYFDVLLLAEAGIGHVVAPLGTALTVDQLRVLKRFTREIVVVFDGDAAGERAAERSLATFLEAGLWGYGAFLPAGDDPDTFVRREGREATLALVARAVPLLDFWLERAVRPETSVPERARVAQQVAQLLRKVADPFEYDMTVRRAAERLGIREELLRRPGAAAGPAAQRGGARAPVGAAAASDGESRVEEILVALMIQGETAAARVDAAGGLALFEDARWRPLAAEIIARGREGAAVDAATLLARLDEATAGRLAGRLLTEPGGEAELARIVDDCLATLRRRELRRRREALRRRIEADEARGNHAAVEQALRELSELRQAERS